MNDERMAFKDLLEVFNSGVGCQEVMVVEGVASLVIVLFPGEEFKGFPEIVRLWLFQSCSDGDVQGVRNKGQKGFWIEKSIAGCVSKAVLAFLELLFCFLSQMHFAFFLRSFKVV